MPGLNVGIEQEFGQIHLVSYKSSHLKGLFGDEHSKGSRNSRLGYDLRTIGYGAKVAKARGSVRVGKARMPLVKIESEGADAKKHQIPEMIGGAVQVDSRAFQIQVEAVRLFKQALATSLRGMPDFHWSITETGLTVQFVKLKRVLELYNSLLQTHSPIHFRPDILAYQMDEQRDGSWGWAVGRKGTIPVTGADRLCQSTVQVNFEVPFRKIGAEGGMPSENFGTAWRTFELCQREARKVVAGLVDRGQEKSKSQNMVDRRALHSLFTLYFYGLVVHWENDRRPKPRDGGQEALATANKSQWEVLPKVRWNDLWDHALDGADRKLIPLKGSGWQDLKGAMNTGLAAISHESKGDHMKEFRPFRYTNAHGAPGFDIDWLNHRHERMFKSQHEAFSSTGKPLPVGQSQHGNVSEPLIVFEVRRSGSEFNREASKILNGGQSPDLFVQKLVAAQTL